MTTDVLQRGLRRIDPALDQSRIHQQLQQYLDLLTRWNRRFNLTAIRDPALMVTRHILDSLSIYAYLNGERFIDVGTGAGLPGLPLAIALPDKHFTLLDSNGKKTRFLVQARTSLGLTNVDIVHERVESFQPAVRFDAVLSRAFAALDDMIAGCRHLIDEHGVLLAMKGQVPDAEIEGIQAIIRDCAVFPLSVPGLLEQRCLVRLRL